MTRIGDYNDLITASVEEYGYHLRCDEDEVFLPRPLADRELSQGDKINLFVYSDIRNNLIATSKRPIAKVNEIAFLPVVDVTTFGAFVDWGIEKDLLIPYKEQEVKMIRGNSYLVRVCFDPRSHRLIGSTKLRDFTETDTDKLQEGQAVELLLYRKVDLGYEAIINQKYLGLIYENEIFEPINIGDSKKGYILKKREDGKIDLRLNPAGMDAMQQAQEKILEKLKQNEGFLPLHDKTDPQIIKSELHLSKKIFKKALGNLYKQQNITLDNDGIRLV
jgi:uncharacterized protein